MSAEEQKTGKHQHISFERSQWMVRGLDWRSAQMAPLMTALIPQKKIPIMRQSPRISSGHWLFFFSADLTAEFCCILMLVWAWPRWLEWAEPGGCGSGASSRLLCGLQAGEQSVLSLSCRREEEMIEDDIVE